MHHFHNTGVQSFLVDEGTREDIIEWLVWNDANGVFTDEDSIAEGYEPLTLDQARELMLSMLKRDDDTYYDG